MPGNVRKLKSMLRVMPAGHQPGRFVLHDPHPFQSVLKWLPRTIDAGCKQQLPPSLVIAGACA
jgi:hypothetical protein